MHSFKVTLEGIDPKLDIFLDPLELETYLGQVAPIEFDSQRFIFAPKIQQWAKKHGLKIPTAKLVIKTTAGMERQIFKPYKGHYKTKSRNYEIQVKDVLFFPRNFSKDSPTFWMWYAESDLLGMFGDDRVAGIRFRRNNIAIGGPERMAELFPGGEGRLNAWTIGEVHVLTDDVIPNARRDGFEATDGWVRVKEEIAPFIRDHKKACHEASRDESRPTQKIVSSAKSIVDKTKKALHTGLSSTDEHERLITQLDREVSRVEKSYNNEKSQADKKTLKSALTSLKTMQGRLDKKEDVYIAQKFKSSLDRKQRKLLAEVMSIIDTVFSEKPCTKNHECLQTIKEAISDKYQTNKTKRNT